MTTDQKGAIAELAIALAALRLGVDVYRPIAEGGQCDFIFEFEGRLWRVQCKWAPRKGGVVLVRCHSCRRRARGLLKRAYDPGEVDAFAAYCLELDRCYFLPYSLFESRTQVVLRLGATQNNQVVGVNWASQFEFGATLGRQGP